MFMMSIKWNINILVSVGSREAESTWGLLRGGEEAFITDILQGHESGGAVTMSHELNTKPWYHLHSAATLPPALMPSRALVMFSSLAAQSHNQDKVCIKALTN